MVAIGPASAVTERGWLSWRRRLEVAVLSQGRLEHFRRFTDRPDRPWVRVGLISDEATGPGELASTPGKLRALVPQSGGPVVYQLTAAGWRLAADQSWVRPARPDAPRAVELGLPADVLRAVCCFGGEREQAITDEAGSVFSYHRADDRRWVRSGCLRLFDPDFVEAANASVKLAQVTGEFDATPTPTGERRPTLSRSLSTAGVRGTDLGVRFEHRGRSFLLFGDTHWSRSRLALRDSIAEVFGDDPLPEVRFHGSPLRLIGGRTSMGEYDVPLDALSLGGELFVFFSSDHFANGLTMGRSVIAKADDPELRLHPSRRHSALSFRYLRTLSRRYFINVSVQLRPAGEVPGCGSEGEVLLIWGTGTYRASEVRLAMLGSAALSRLSEASPLGDAADLELRYWAGDGRWVNDEAEAVALFRPGAYGEVSVRWVGEVGRYAMLTASGPDDSAGLAVTLRWAEHPWGPWTPRLRLLDWVAGGMHPDRFTRFIKASSDDEVAEAIFAAQARGGGAAYAPYLFDARREGNDMLLRYTLSTWNPYQVVLMEHRLEPGEF